jgi:VanZ family protein
VRPRIAQILIPAWLRAWWPALVWAGVIFFMSTDTFSSEHTKWILVPVIHWVRPSLTPWQIEAVHHFIRKSAHFTEYFIFCVLLFRGIRGARQGWRWTWGVAALSIAAGYSILDEIHQAFVASRTASPYDSLLDSVGALVAFGMLWLWFRIARANASAEPQRVLEQTSGPA